MTMDDFIAKYGTRSVSLMVAEFIKRAPIHMQGGEFAIELTACMVDLESALQDYAETACVTGDI